MKRDLLAQSLQQMRQRENLESSSAPSEPQNSARAREEKPGAPSGPKSLKNMSDVLTQVSAQAAQEIDTAEIADSEIADRFDVQDGLADLTESIRAAGQQLPVLVRYRRGAGPRYEVVYGRRRIAACRALGIPVKAYIKDMSLREALMSQALENSARLERSFIEQAVFAAKLEEAEFKRAEICEALAVDKGTLSRLISVVRDVPGPLVQAIGAAHESGRRPWSELRRLVLLDTTPGEDDLVAMIDPSLGPDERLTRMIAELQRVEARGRFAKAPSPAPQPTRVSGGRVSYKSRNGKITIEVKSETDFIRYLEENLETIFEDWSNEHG